MRQILVKKDPIHIRTKPGVVIEGDKVEIRFGWWLPRKNKLKVRDL